MHTQVRELGNGGNGGKCAHTVCSGKIILEQKKKLLLEGRLDSLIGDNCRKLLDTEPE